MAKLTFIPSGQEVIAAVGENLLDICQKLGFGLKCRCRKGRCHKCLVEVNCEKKLSCLTTIQSSDGDLVVRFPSPPRR